jgi:hypothetical protein
MHVRNLILEPEPPGHDTSIKPPCSFPRSEGKYDLIGGIRAYEGGGDVAAFVALVKDNMVW